MVKTLSEEVESSSVLKWFNAFIIGIHFRILLKDQKLLPVHSYPQLPPDVFPATQPPRDINGASILMATEILQNSITTQIPLLHSPLGNYGFNFLLKCLYLWILWKTKTLLTFALSFFYSLATFLEKCFNVSLAPCICWVKAEEH